MGSLPMLTEGMSLLQRGHFSTESSATLVSAAAAPQCGQCRLPINIIPKQEGQAIVASFDSQYWHRGESEEIAAPQLGQLRVSAFIVGAHASLGADRGHRARMMQLNIATSVGTTRISRYQSVAKF